MNETEKCEKRSVYAGLGIFIIAGAVLAIVGFLMLRPADDYYQGQVEATSVRVSGKLPGRVAELYVEEGDKVQAGDTIAKIYSSTADAKLMQAEAMQSAAQSQREKADAGARGQVITAAQSLWQQAMAAEEIHRKTYERVEKLFKQEVVSEQKRDEALAEYNAQGCCSCCQIAVRYGSGRCAARGPCQCCLDGACSAGNSGRGDVDA